MPDTGNAKDCLELSPTNFSIFTLKNVTWRTYLISFPVQYCFLFRFVCIELFSLIWFLQIWVVKKFMQRYIVIVSASILNVSTVYLNGIWYLICRYLLKPFLGRHPVLSGHCSFPRGCPLNTLGFTVFVDKGEIAAGIINLLGYTEILPTVLLILKSGQLIANQIWEFWYSKLMS